jgi:septum formation protein
VLQAAGFSPLVVVSDIVEDGIAGSSAPDMARALAQRKAAAVAERLVGAAQPSPRPVVVGCDSVLSFAGEVRGKPASAEQAAEWCRGYRGRTGTLASGQALVDLATGRSASGVAQTTVRFGHPTDAEIDAYVATGEPLAVAGGFTIDGYAGPFVEGIEGDHGTVLGLSLPLLRHLLTELGIAVTDLWAR